MRCPRCFYLHRRLGVSPPKMIPLTLAIATDALKMNSMPYVVGDVSHPVWDEYNLNVNAYQHEDISCGEAI